ncbi:MAG TPA: GTPase [Gemmataceae bacterium]|nr:GTPase [Gemmataceae bacterium]
MSATYLAHLTPPGAAAIATLALRGPAAWSMVGQLAQRSLPPEPEVGRFRLTRLGDAAQGAVDEVILAVKQSEPEPWLELHCHGGPEVLKLLEDLLDSRGAEVCSWQHMEQQATSPLQAVALATLAAALTVRTAAIALDQVHGAFAQAVARVLRHLRQGEREAAGPLLADLDRWGALGRHLTSPWRVVLAGPVNVGKSSLANALAGYQRSLVAATPGTTRDVVTTLLAVDGWPIEIADTAGWRATELAVEQEGMARARQALAATDLGLWVLDASQAPEWPAANLGPVRFVVNKVDLPPQWSIEDSAALRVSAKTGAGIGKLCQQLAAWLVPDVPPPGAAVPFTPELADTVSQTRQLLASGESEAARENLEQLNRECG